MNNICRTLLLLLAFHFILPNQAAAYVGPGAGITAIGSFLALLAAIVAAIFGFIWFPVKRFIKRRKRAKYEQKTINQPK